MTGRARQTARPSSPTLAALLALLAALLILPVALAPRAEAYVYWSSGPYGFDIGRANLDGSGLDQSFITRSRPNAVVNVAPVRVDAGHIYWSEFWGGPDEDHSALGRARLDGAHVDENFIRSAWFAALDGNDFYSADNRWAADRFVGASILRRDLDGGRGPKELITGLAGPVVGIAVDRNHIYWAQDRGCCPFSRGQIAAIGRANLDGTEVEREFITFPDPAVSPRAVALDASHVYWATGYSVDFSYPTIGRANLNGTGVDRSFITRETLVFNPTDLAVDADHIYWASPIREFDPTLSGSIGRANLDGTNVDERFIVPPVPADPVSVAVDSLTNTTIRAKASAKRIQKQRGGRIRVKVRVKAKERLTARATGEVEINPTYTLKPLKVQVAAGKTKMLRLRPKKANAKKIAKALKRGEKATAKLKVKLTGRGGNGETEKLRVRLKRG